ncbi:MAG: T9SS type A sorting domain-containing protein, partial [Paraprevotella sp.]|nr:T9SS type A sorting domain-containing protein [Paraprevotella sp.]
DYLHVDVYSNEDAEFCIGFQNWVPGEEVYSKVVNVAAGKWNSYDFPLSDIFVTNEARNANVLRINKYITDVDPGTKFAKEIYVSNIYVYKGEPASIVRSANSSAEEVAIYPATVKDYLHVDAGQNVDAVKLYSVSGSLVLSSGAGINQINVSSLPKGVYIVTVTLADGSVTNKKIMKQ